MNRLHNLPIASVVNSPPMHREAARGSDAATFQRVVPLHRGVRLTDSRQIGENEFVELGSPFHWTTYVCVIVCTTVALYFGWQFCRAYLAGVL